MLPATTDVLICGAGPTGLTLATTLAARGTGFVLIDKLAAIQDTSRAAVVHARTLEVLEPLGISSRLIERGLVAPEFTMRDRDRVLLRLNFSELQTKFPFLLLLPQNITEAVLADRLGELGGAIDRQHELVAASSNTDGVVATVRASDGEREIRARYVVGADGLHSAVRDQAGIGFETGTYKQSFILGDVMAKWPFPDTEGQLYLAPEGFLLVVPFGNGHYRIVATQDNAPAAPSIADLQAMLDSRGPSAGGGRIDSLTWSSRFRIHHGVASRYRDGRMLIAGDAAHVHSPAGGQGMNTGIQDARFLGELLADVIAGKSDDAALDGYERERRPIAQGVVAMTDRATRMSTLHSPFKRRLRNLAVETVGHVPAMRRMIAHRMAELQS